MPAGTSHHLPVTIRVAHCETDLRKVLAVRAAAAGGAGAKAADPAPETWDERPNATLLLAESRVDGEPLGSLRIILAGERGRLAVQDRIDLPAVLKADSIAEASRLAVRPGRNATLVRLMLWKAFHRYCLAAQADTMLIAVREPADRQYEWLGFRDPQSGPIRFAPDGRGAATHRLMVLGVFEARERALGVGPLKTAAGEAFDLHAELKKQPALVIFYRGGWCPYCNKHLAEIQKIQAELKAAGFQILAVSPDAPEKAGETAQKGGLGYTLLSDTGLNAAKGFKLAFRLDEGTIEKYKKYKLDLSSSDWCLPVPAAYLVGSDGKVLFGHANPDYKVRIDNAKILEAAQAANPEPKMEEKTEGK